MPVSPGTKQNSFLGWSVKVEQRKVNISRYCFPRRKFVKIMLPGTTSHLLQTSMINYEFNNHLSTMLRVINCLAWCLPVAIYFLARRSEHSTITLQTQCTPLSSPASFHHSITPLTPHIRLQSQLKLHYTSGGAGGAGVNTSQLSTYRIYLTAWDGLSVNTNLRARIH